jgi:hypothetical protein
LGGSKKLAAGDDWWTFIATTSLSLTTYSPPRARSHASF